MGLPAEEALEGVPWIYLDFYKQTVPHNNGHLLKESDRLGIRIICDVLVYPLQGVFKYSTRLSHNKLSTMSPPCDNWQETLPDHSCGDLDQLSHVMTGDRAELISEISQKGIDTHFGRKT